MTDFKNVLPSGKGTNDIVKNLEKIEIGRINSYLVKSFSTFTNPNYLPDDAIMNKSVDWLSKNVIKGELKREAIKDFPNLTQAAAIKRSATNLAETILMMGKVEGKNPLKQLQDIGKLINFKDYKF